MIETAQKIISDYFHTTLHVENVIQLSEPDRRNLILRIYISSPSDHIPTSFIIKKTTIEIKGETEQEQMSRFARDWAGIEFLTKIGSHHAPHFYGGNLEHQFIILEDLGEPHYSLVGPLTYEPTSENIHYAMIALETYTRRAGKMHADTFGKTKEFEKILHAIYPKALRLHSLQEKDMTDFLSCIKHHLKIDSIALHQEVEDIHTTISADGFKVLLHGDICPDNVYFQNAQMQMIDFEYGDIGHALIDGVYLRMSMPSCWCSKSVPENIVAQMESIYHDELQKKIESATIENFNKALVYACAFWVIRVINWHVDELMQADKLCPSGPVDKASLWNPEENVFRPRVLSRLQAFVDLARKHQYLPELSRVASDLINYLKGKWPTSTYMDYFPVFMRNQ